MVSGNILPMGQPSKSLRWLAIGLLVADRSISRSQVSF